MFSSDTTQEKSPQGAVQPLLHSSLPPPPYGRSCGVAHEAQVYQLPTALQPTSTVIVLKERRRRRFLRALLIAISLWVIYRTFVQSNMIGSFRNENPRWSVGPGSASPDYPIPPEVQISSCEEPLNTGGGFAQTTFEVPVSAQTALLLSNGPWLSGKVHFTTSADHQGTIKYIVNLESRNNYDAHTIVCFVEREEGAQGVGIFNPRHPYGGPLNNVRYDVVVELPLNSEAEPTTIERFETRVANSVIYIEDLRNGIEFEELSLHTSNGGIHSESLYAEWAEIHTTNGPILGYFNTSNTLSLRTSNSPIDVSVDFSHEEADKAVLSMTTSNGHLRAKLALHTPTDDGGHFEVTTKTSNAPLDVQFDSAPVDSYLTLEARTSNSPADVTLHPTYEGHFSLHSSLFGGVVHENPDVEDPAERGRRRKVRYHATRGQVEGDVSWSDEAGKGHVGVTSSNARVTLNL